MDTEDGTRRDRDEAGAAPVGRDQVFARPAWLGDFADPDDDPPPRGARAEGDDLWDEEPTGWRATVDRVRTTPRAAIALIVVGVIGAIVAAVAVLGPSDGAESGPYPVVDFAGAASSASRGPSAAGRPTPPAASASAVPTTAAPTELVVAVVGLVRAPGLHRLPPGSRIADALAAAKGALRGADTAGLNLAQQLRDGDQVVVGVVDKKAGVSLRSAVLSGAAGPGAGGAESGTPAAAPTSGAAGGTVNINTANAAELDRLPGVGEATAAAIIEYREKNGPFASVDDLAKVSGIGDAKLARIRPMASV
ncbi:ComEA family DNA-binding protein [Tsukamurella sp. 1534]|uniref:ComEA family DNA-binding protein n=1 Tax=Tsukamurella sp. 1534 TaxID=1151061 RepID=UPI00030A9F92|nr:ComEA family DNA-binding protein [Tsukamurella sp. 1534]